MDDRVWLGFGSLLARWTWLVGGDDQIWDGKGDGDRFGLGRDLGSGLSIFFVGSGDRISTFLFLAFFCPSQPTPILSFFSSPVLCETD